MAIGSAARKPNILEQSIKVLGVSPARAGKCGWCYQHIKWGMQEAQGRSEMDSCGMDLNPSISPLLWPPFIPLIVFSNAESEIKGRYI